MARSLLTLCVVAGLCALALVPGLADLHGLFIKAYTVVHMSRVLTGSCHGIPKLAVATVMAMVLV